MEEYILSHIDAESEYLRRLYRDTHLQLLYPHMVSGHLQGRVLKMLTALLAPKQVLEIGTYSGYSALCMAEALPEDGLLHTIEINDEQETFTRKWLEGSPQAAKIRFYIGDALQLAPALGIGFDLIYIDGDKRSYIDYYEMSLALLNEGGCILVDNTLWDGHVLEAHPASAQTLSIQAFNDYVAADQRVEKVILPLRDGLSIVRKRA
ncbi:MAG: class I SAM-dependent methyltransferase [Prevotellaceae bacterium]|nr:class I SAM-dependent methyltransferase [Prevotellaceae bacterium]